MPENSLINWCALLYGLNNYSIQIFSLKVSFNFSAMKLTCRYETTRASAGKLDSLFTSTLCYGKVIEDLNFSFSSSKCSVRGLLEKGF